DHVAAHKAKTLKKLNKPLTFCKKFMEIGNRFYSSVVIFNIIFFIWGMEIVAVQAKAHKNNFYSQLLFKNRANRNASTTTNRDRVFLKNFFYGFSGSLVAFAVDWCHVGFTAVMFKCFYGNTGRGN